MDNLSGHRRPPQIVGEVVFTSYDGLRAEANGVLGFLTFDQRLLEMRNAEILAALPAYSTANYGIIVQYVLIDQASYWLIGAVRKVKDFHKRPGILGSAICMEGEDVSLVGVDTYLFDILQAEVDDVFEDSWKGRPLPRKLNVLSGIPSHEVKVEFRSNPATELAYASEQINVGSAVEAAIKVVRYSNTIGRAIVMPTETANVRRIDQNYVNEAEAHAKRVEQERSERAEQTRLAREAERQRAQQEYENEQINKEQRAVAALMEFDHRARELEHRASLSGLSAAFDDHGAQLEYPAPRSLDDLIAQLRDLQTRIVMLEKTVPGRRKAAKSKSLPIDTAMKRGSRITPQVERNIIFAIMALVLLIVFVWAIIWLWPSGEAEAAAQLSNTPDTELSISEQSAPLTPSSLLPAPTTDEQIVRPPASQQEDCSLLETFREQTECENIQPTSP